ncbi:hypothetical protein BS329_34255 [Amycolatopsis coloradensis]|uniref:Uncharacterized protein n=1 Tax=Amycolatopsis coloradensis TaxID=76021 RepID=A0A1R0KID2_9PSEU|nr:hypothetical protein [Amycolatopsis coloradensis]OLZ45479.1 hypothetical protein BS329_34255 [Amycolatopsis coloradensis]
MPNKLTTAVAVAVMSLAFAAPANAETRYYQQTVTGSTKAECETAGSQLAQQKRAEGFLVTWTGCGYRNFQYSGLVGWSD